MELQRSYRIITITQQEPIFRVNSVLLLYRLKFEHEKAQNKIIYKTTEYVASDAAEYCWHLRKITSHFQLNIPFEKEKSWNTPNGLEQQVKQVNIPTKKTYTFTK